MKTFDKDPEAVLDYEWDWTEWLGTDTIDTALVGVVAGDVVIDDFSNTINKVTAWISGGTLNEPTVVTCSITTGEGRTDERSVRFNIKSR